MKYLITGHTGFIGSWLSLYLKLQGHSVSGFSLPNDKEKLKGGMFFQTGLSDIFDNDIRGSIENLDDVKSCIDKVKPDFVFHLAAQREVGEGYKRPIDTWNINVIGTVNLFESIKDLSIPCIVVTTDKVYKNTADSSAPKTGFIETDQLGAQDPMSASKTAADLVAQSYSYQPGYTGPIAIARSANIIGGGDGALDTLFVSICQALKQGKEPELKMPQSVRPWQSVLDAISGYVALADQIKNFDGEAFNIGASEDGLMSVGDISTLLCDKWGSGINWKFVGEGNPDIKEEGMLALNSNKAINKLNWNNKLSVDEAINFVVEFEKSNNKRDTVEFQIEKFLKG
jgi:CDP-glucose 4,6-dehydratase